MGSRRALFLSSGVVLLVAGSAWAESPRAPGALPLSFTRGMHAVALAEPVIPEPINREAVLQEDSQTQQEGGSLRFAICRTVSVSPQTQGVWEDVDENTMLWRVPVTAPGALSLSLGFSRYFMPPGGRLYVYSADHTQVLGPFTAKDNKTHGQLWTPLVHGDSLVVELEIPLPEVPKLQLELTYVNHGYRDLAPALHVQDLGEAAYCQHNVACPEGDAWRDQIRAVARFHVTRTGDGGAYWDTGFLINNTRQDETPYFWAALHSFDDLPKDQRLTDTEKGYAASMVIYWNFQAATCGGMTGSESQQQRGATFVAGNGQTDFALVQLDEKPAPEFNVYYAGWDRRMITPSSGVAIHHPQGDMKKISVENDPILSWSPSYVENVDYGECFRVMGWDVGMTEAGSSGCPLFNSEKRVVGHLIAGAGTCGDPGSTVSVVGPLYRSWNEGERSDQRLRNWLDPLNTGVVVLDGKNASAPQLTTVTINFDDEDAPCNFSSSMRLTTEYQALGVTFDGPNATDGGAILGQCGNFSVTGYSYPNFLAFHDDWGLRMVGGGRPRGPETLIFSRPVQRVSILAGTGPTHAGPLTLQAFDAQGRIVDTETLLLTSVLTPVAVSAPGITRVVISAAPHAFVLDDLTFSY